MTARRKYQVAFYALGWMVAIAIVLQGTAGSVLRGALARADETITRMSQSLSNAEGDAWRRVRGGSRRELLASLRPSFASRAALGSPSRMLFGAYDGGFPDSFRGLEALESQLAYRFPIISFYQAWGDRPYQAHFPMRMVETIDRLGSVPMITWEPWVKDFDGSRRTNLPPIAQREYATLASVARGDYDFYITPWATEAARFGKPLLIRFAHEMNDPYRYPWGPQNGNRPEDFIAAWKHVHLVFQKMNATNVLWVWSPHISMPWFEYYYPGDEWVDWVGTGVLNYGNVATWSRWWTFEQIFGKAYPVLEKLRKPIMITEFGTLTSGGDARQWYRDALRDAQTRYPGVRAIVFFNQEYDVTLSTAPLNWSVLQSASSTVVLRNELRKSAPPS